MQLGLCRISNTDTSKSISMAYFHIIMKYGIVSGCNSSKNKTSQKKTDGVNFRNSCKFVSQGLEISILLLE